MAGRFAHHAMLPKKVFYDHLVFALRYEGIDLAVLNALFAKINKSDLEQAIIRQPNSLYARRIWFLFEYLQEIELDIPDLTQGNFVHLIDIKLQYAGPSSNSKRHRIRNNLPGIKNFVHLSDVQKKSMRLSSKIYQNKLWVFSVLFIPMYYFVLQVFYYWKIHKLHMLLRKKPHHKIEWNAGGVLLVKQERFPYQKHTWSTYKMR